MLDAGGHTAGSAVKKTGYFTTSGVTTSFIGGRCTIPIDCSARPHRTKNSGTYPVHEPIADFEDLPDVDFEAPASWGEADVRGDAALGP